MTYQNSDPNLKSRVVKSRVDPVADNSISRSTSYTGWVIAALVLAAIIIGVFAYRTAGGTNTASTVPVPSAASSAPAAPTTTTGSGTAR